MTIYFVRHGEGHHNANGLYSTPDFELTEKGKDEARSAGQRLKHLPIELLVVSSYVRTRQTAEIINTELGEKPVVFSDLPVEIKRPSEIAGKSINAPENMAIRKQLAENALDPNWHYSDEENFFDLRERAYKFLGYLETLKNHHVAVISHSVFIKMLVLLIIAGNDLNPKTFDQSYKTMQLATSGLTVFSFEKDTWSLVTWNDQSHLGE